MTPYDLSPLWDNEDYWAMMRTVAAHPKERTPRYILADWLDERGFAAEALKHRINGAAKANVAEILESGHVECREDYANTEFWNEVAKWHNADAKAVLRIQWNKRGLQHYVKVQGPLLFSFTWTTPNPSSGYRDLRSISNLYGVNAKHVRELRLTKLLINHFPNLRYLNTTSEACRNNNWELLRSLPRLESMEFDWRRNVDLAPTRYCSNAKLISVDCEMIGREAWQALDQMDFQTLHLNVASGEMQECFTWSTSMCERVEFLWLSHSDRSLGITRSVLNGPDLRGFASLKKLSIFSRTMNTIELPPNLKTLSVPNEEVILEMARRGGLDHLIELECWGGRDWEIPVLPNLRSVTVNHFFSKEMFDWIRSLPQLRTVNLRRVTGIPSVLNKRLLKLPNLKFVDKNFS